MLPDRSVIQADGDDLSFITVRVEDKDGTLCPVADSLTVEQFHADYRKTFNGWALLIVRSLAGQSEKIRGIPTAEGLAQDDTQKSARRRWHKAPRKRNSTRGCNDAVSPSVRTY
ncbi:MAG: hypothetical protein ACHP8A_14440 [Terriglobales bacterium]